MRSMTGYGKAKAVVEKRELTIELKSVNHRFLDLNLKIPKLFNSLEETIRKGISEQVTRGHVDVYVNFVDKSEKEREVAVDLGLARGLIQAAKTLESEFGLKNDVTVVTLLKSSDVVKAMNEEESGDEWKELINSALTDALAQLNVMRDFEGSKLKEDLTTRINEVKQLAKSIDSMKSAVADEYAARLKNRIKEALQGVEFDEARFLTEVAYFVDKSNIDEEITRLNSHISHFIKTINSGGSIGKQLDFLTQELNREANTVCSKANHAEITALGLKLKNEIEKIREQIQNVE